MLLGNTCNTSNVMSPYFLPVKRILANAYAANDVSANWINATKKHILREFSTHLTKLVFWNKST